MSTKRWSDSSVMYEMNIRQLTQEGTLAAALSHLQTLHNIGVDCVWLMPIYPIGSLQRKGSLGSYYSIRDYTAVNPEFGTMADFDAFVAEAHRLGIKVLLDWVANHTSRDAVWLTEKPKDWYERDEQSGEAKVPWDWSDTAQLNYSNHDVWCGQRDAMKFWIEEHNIDGFRCDMAMLPPIEFWNEVNAELREIKPDIFMLAEAEGADLFDNGAFNSCYGWELHHLMNDVAKQHKRCNVIRDWVRYNLERFPRSTTRLMFTSNHDENTWSGSEFSRMGEAHRVMAMLTYVLPMSLPLIYTGQEYGYDHSFEFFDKDAMPAMDANCFTEFYTKLSHLRHQLPALHSGENGGEYIEIGNNAEDCLMTFVREAGDSRVVVIANLSPYVIQANFYTGIYAGNYMDAFTGEKYELRGLVDEHFDAWCFRVLIDRK